MPNGKFISPEAGVEWCWLVWCELLQVTTSYYGLLRVGAGWCELVRVGAGDRWSRMVSDGVGRSLSKGAALRLSRHKESTHSRALPCSHTDHRDCCVQVVARGIALQDVV